VEAVSDGVASAPFCYGVMKSNKVTQIAARKR